MKEPTTDQAQRSECPNDIRLAGWPKLFGLRAKLCLKAKQEKHYRFYSLYNHITQRETLDAAFALVVANDGACGVDGVTIASLTEHPMDEIRFLDELQKELIEKTYRAQPVRRVYIEKVNGKLRPLGIPTVRDRVVQCAVKLIIEPIFEQDFLESSYGFRPGRKGHDAIQAVGDNLKSGRVSVYDADLSSYFDTIPHDKLMEGVRKRIVDGAVLGLIHQWLNAPVVEKPQVAQSRREKSRRRPKGGLKKRNGESKPSHSRHAARRRAQPAASQYSPPRV
jgi:RNA-directed DNA polymerase